ncbi:MAG: septal ring lytic transglycosylase RlpA family protein [Candidatus Sericytochromatia bacterium]|uniref:Probable endolytic peptidoglycan transglycosylase RlpA n=1 Tax=Candidatus Tanganyikabacteria bacterium TaxID=2961651 RepID=A0A938BMZ1_9BACT|nr:septal ring lytic transglycosylase RlpA family protein [Candidatus Tanganyikabacteria bacterium]
MSPYTFHATILSVLALGMAAVPASATRIDYVAPDRYATWLMAADEVGKPTTFVVVGDKVAWSFRGDWKVKAKQASDRLNGAWREGLLRSDHIRPGKRDRQFVVRCDRHTLLVVDNHFAKAQAERPAALALSAIDGLRKALGGIPLAQQVSRDGLPGVNARSGVASWYGGFFHGRTAADGSRFDKTDYTMASRTLKLGTLVLVQNPRNGKAVLVRVTDRGPYIHGRSLDLSQRTAQVLGIESAGVASVRYYVFPQ